MNNRFVVTTPGRGSPFLSVHQCNHVNIVKVSSAQMTL